MRIPGADTRVAREQALHAAPRRDSELFAHPAESGKRQKLHEEIVGMLAVNDRHPKSSFTFLKSSG